MIPPAAVCLNTASKRTVIELDDKELFSYSTDYGDGFDSGSSFDDNRDPEAPLKVRKGCLFKIISALLILTGLLLIASGIYIISVLSSVRYSKEYPDHTVAENEGVVLRERSGVTNIMIFGEDNHEDGENGRSDSMIMLSVDDNSRKLRTVSFMRDLYVYIPGHGYDRLNAAYVYGGPKLTMETIELNFGIRTQYFMTVDFNSFTDIIDSFGGIELELTAEEIDYINWQSFRNHQTDSEAELDKSDYTFTENSSGDMTATVKLSGRQALWYARDRDSAGSDFDRTQRQRIVLDRIMTKLHDGGPINMLLAVRSLSKYLTTNFNPLELTSEGFSLIKALSYEREQYRTPTSDNYFDYWAGSALVLAVADMELECQRLYEFLAI